MKIKVILITLFVFLFVSLQTQAKMVDMKGQIINSNDTLDVTFRIPVGWLTGEILKSDMQSRIEYYYVKGKRLFIEPKFAKAIVINSKYGGTIKLFSVEVETGILSYKKSAKFLEREVTGKVDLYKYIYSQTYGTPGTSGFGSVSKTAYVLVKGKQSKTFYQTLGIKTELAGYFADCPELKAKIDSRELKYKDMGRIARFYNQNCND